MFTHFMSAWLKKRPLSTWCALCFKSYLFSMFFSSKDPDSSFVIYIIFRLKLITYLINSQHLPLTFLIKRKRMNTFFIRRIWKYLHLKSTRVPQGNILGPMGDVQAVKSCPFGLFASFRTPGWVWPGWECLSPRDNHDFSIIINLHVQKSS